MDKFPLRQNGLPNNVAAAEFLADEAKGYGFKTRILEFEAARTPHGRYAWSRRSRRAPPSRTSGSPSSPTTTSSPVPASRCRARTTMDPGTNILRYFAKAFSKVKTNRTIALLWFDAEENGLSGLAGLRGDAEEEGAEGPGRLRVRHGRHRLPGALLHLRLPRLPPAGRGHRHLRSPTTSTSST